MKQIKNIPQGYKDSPLGIIPEDWEVKRLHHIMIEGRLGGNYENSESNEGLPVIKMGNVQRGFISVDKIQNLPKDEDYNPEDILKRGDLLFNTRNTLDLVGKVAIWDNQLPLALYNSNLMRMKFDKKCIISTLFMNYAFNSQYVLSQLKGIATGTTSVAAIYGRDLDKIKFKIPLLLEQQKITEILTCWDEAIEKQTRIIEKLETRKCGLMQQLLTGKKRLKGFKSEIMFKPLKPYIKELSIRNKESIKTVLSVTNQNGFILQINQFDRMVASENLSNYKVVKKRQFAFNPSRVNVGSLDLLETFEEGVLSPMYIVFETNERLLLSKFLYYQLKTDWFIDHIPMFVQGSVRDSLSFDGLGAMKFFIPSIEEQIAIINILSTADKEIQERRAKLNALKSHKNGLMQVLLTGKKRVKI